MLRPKISVIVSAAIAITMVAGTASTPDRQSSTPFDGMDGRHILEAVHADHRPSVLLTDKEEIRRIIMVCASAPDGVRDYFSTGTNAGSHLLRIAPPAWWSDASADYASAINDLHNIVPANEAVETIRRDYPPGIVSKADFSNGNWLCGEGSVDEQPTNLYEPDDEFKGDIARIYLYMAAAYPQSLWHGRAPVVYLDGYYPLLTSYGRRLFLDWHRGDPVDRRELYRDSVIAAAQGNHNPFVVYPELAEYVWGRYSDGIFNDTPVPPGPDLPPGPDEPQPSDPVSDPIMLKSHYSVSADGHIDFRSPYVEAGSKWTFDGKTCNTTSMDLDEVAPGRYEITYSNSHSSGRILITVEP